MMALAGVELETLVSEPDALTTRPLLKFCCDQQHQIVHLPVVEFQGLATVVNECHVSESHEHFEYVVHYLPLISYFDSLTTLLDHHQKLIYDMLSPLCKNS